MDQVCMDQFFLQNLETSQKCPSLSGNGSDHLLLETVHLPSFSKPKLHFSQGNLHQNISDNLSLDQGQLLSAPLISTFQHQHLPSSTEILYLVLSIPFRFLYALQTNIPSTYLLLMATILFLALLRHRLHFWRRRGLPFESLTAHLSYFSHFSNLLPLNDLSRVRRHGRLFGSFHLLRPVLCIADHRVAEQVLFTKADCFSVQKTWQLEGHLLGNSIFNGNSKSTKSLDNLDEWKRKKATLLSAFLSRKIKLLGPTVDGLSSQLLAFIDSRKFNKRSKKKFFKSTLDDLTTPFLVYSLCTLVLDLDLPLYRRFAEQENAETLLSSCRSYLEASRKVRQCPLYRVVTPFWSLDGRHLLSKANRQALTSLLTDAIEYRLENGLVGLAEAGSKRPSRRRSVKFREKLVEFKCIEPTPERDQVECQPPPSLSPPLSPPPARPSSPKAQLKELTFIDILLDQDAEMEPEDKLLDKDKGTSSLNRDELIDNLLAFFTVGLSTLSGALSSILFYLAAYPEEQEKVRTEIVDCLRDHQGKIRPPSSSTCKISWEELRSLKYTEAAIREALRLSGPVERLERVVTSKSGCSVDSADFGPIKLPPGTLVHILSAAIHRSGEHFPEPDTFKPSRFYKDVQIGCSDKGFESAQKMAASDDAAAAGKYLAFGMGARTCIGLKFATFYLKHLVANLLEQFEVRLGDRRWYHRTGGSPLNSRQLGGRTVELHSLENSSSKQKLT